MSTSPNYLDDQTLIHRLQLESELRTIQAQTHESQKTQLKSLRQEAEELGCEVNRLTEENNELADVVAAHDGKRIIEEEEYASLKAAEHHLSRLLHRVNRSPLGLLARRRPGFRAMVEQWPQEEA